jgi:hypothetical protein
MGKVETLSRRERIVYAVKKLVAEWGTDGTRWYIEDQMLRIARMRKDEAMVRTYQEWLVVLDELEEAN